MDLAELERLYAAHADALFAFLVNLTRSDSDAGDALQEVFRKLVARPELMSGVQEERRFLLRLARHQAIDLTRRQSARRRAHDALAQEPAEIFAPSSDPDEQAFRTELTEALAELPEEQRAVVHLKWFEGLTFDQIAEVLDIPLNTAASRHRYALDKMRSRLRPLYDESR